MENFDEVSLDLDTFFLEVDPNDVSESVLFDQTSLFGQLRDENPNITVQYENVEPNSVDISEVEVIYEDQLTKQGTIRKRKGSSCFDNEPLKNV